MNKKVWAVCLILCLAFSLCGCSKEPELTNGGVAQGDELDIIKNFDGTITYQWRGDGARQVAEYYKAGNAYLTVYTGKNDSQEYYKVESCYCKDSIFTFYFRHGTTAEETVTALQIDEPKKPEDISQIVITKEGITITLTFEQTNALINADIDTVQIKGSTFSEELKSYVSSSIYPFEPVYATVE